MNLVIKEDILLDESMTLTEKATLALIENTGLETIDSYYLCNYISITRRHLIRVLYSLRDKGYIVGDNLAAKHINIKEINI